MQLDGRVLAGEHPLAKHGEITVREYKARSPLVHPQGVMASIATDFGALVMRKAIVGDTIEAFQPGDWIVSDNPPTHAWVMKPIVFEASYEEA